MIWSYRRELALYQTWPVQRYNISLMLPGETFPFKSEHKARITQEALERPCFTHCKFLHLIQYHSIFPHSSLSPRCICELFHDTLSSALAVVCQLSTQYFIIQWRPLCTKYSTHQARSPPLFLSRLNEIVVHQVSNQELRCISVLKYFHQATTLFMQYQDICALPCSVYM